MAAESIYRDFATVLDEMLVDEAARRGWSDINGTSLDYLTVTEALHSGRIVISDDAAAATYREAMETRGADAPPRPAKAGSATPPRPLPSTDPAEIARELGLDKAGADLDLLRRRFAFSNHPDRVEPGLRVVAMARMQVANMLIDEAKKRRATNR